MSCYVVSYDLRQPEKTYDRLRKVIKRYDQWARINESVWAVVTDQSAVEVRDNLAKYVDANDRLFVVRSGGEAAWGNAVCEDDWLRAYL